MILSGHQPCYLPGLQFFNKVMHSDAFIYVPHCQYLAGSWHSHNFICTGKLTVPVHATLGQSIQEVTIDYTKTWQRKHLHAVELAYSKTPFFGQYHEELRWILNTRHSNLAHLNIALTEWLAEELDCGPYDKLFYTHRTHSTDPIDMIIEMCKSVDADTYLSNGGAVAYIGPDQEKRMLDAGIIHRWQWWNPPEYGQEHKHNNGWLSVLDILFHKGPEAIPIIRDSGGIT